EGHLPRALHAHGGQQREPLEGRGAAGGRAPGRQPLHGRLVHVHGRVAPRPLGRGEGGGARAAHDRRRALDRPVDPGPAHEVALHELDGPVPEHGLRLGHIAHQGPHLVPGVDELVGNQVANPSGRPEDGYEVALGDGAHLNGSGARTVRWLGRQSVRH
ncbi:unnamed protein product, partial [Heterosigma akashiwo]